MDIYDRILKFQKEVNKQDAERNLLLKQREETELQIEKLEETMETYTKVMRLLQLTSEYARAQMVTRIEQIVTNALNVIFNEDISFKVELGVRAGQPTAEFYVVDGDRQDSPMDARGGGLVDVISTALRLAVLELYEPRIEGPVVLDEPGKMVSAEYIENFAYFLKEYSKGTGRQIIMITHNKVLAEIADKSFQVRLQNKESIVEHFKEKEVKKHG